uniref:palmitoyl-protein thioesterase 1-like isoform X3 n=1 Tax=Erigeron canadensis TaxID=72917 RepID=UPI001CB93F58|nr:palmitoyl-protein thioesterase 1-like isoform X3 [Erigeron canadensis]
MTFLFFILVILPTLSCSLPFIVLHGIGDQCSNRGITKFTQELTYLSNSQGFCIEIGNGAWDSWFMPLLQQTQSVCNQVKKMKQLRNGYNIVGLSQGNLIGRGVVEICDGGPQVKNLVSLGGPHAGTASVPLCGNMDAYLQHCRFLPKVNNEVPDERNSTYKDRFSSLQNLVLIMFEQDTVLIPKETAWFGYFPYGEFTPALAPQQTKLYIDDWIGLKTLDEAGRVKYINVSGNHLEISEKDIKKHVIPYLKDDDIQEITIDDEIEKVALLEGYSTYTWPPSINNFFSDLFERARQ